MEKAPPKRKPARANVILGAVLLVLTGLLAAWVFLGDREREVPREDWVEWQSTDGKYTAEFPVEPELQTATRDLDGLDVTLEFHLEVAELPYRAYAVGWSDYPIDFVSRSDPDDVLDQAMERGAQSLEGTLADRSEIELEGNPGREFSIETDSGQHANYRIYLVGPRLYQLAVMHTEPFTPEAGYFLDSFRLSG